MKKISINYLKTVLFLSIVLSFGCTDRLIEEPKSIISPVNYFKSKADFTAAINGILRNHRGEFTSNGVLLLCGGGEDITSNQTNPEYLQYDEFKPTLTGPWALGGWRDFYRAVNEANLVVTKIADASEISATDKKYFEGQARYLRAFSYYYLVRWFGKIPIITSENQLDAVNVPESEVVDVYKYMEEDLKYAEANLPPTFSEKGRPTSIVAKALLAELYLTWACWPVKDATKYALARDKAKEVMDLDMFELEPHQADLWLSANKFTNKEFIFIINASSGAARTGSSIHHQGMRPSEEGGWDDIMTEPRFIAAFPDGPRKDATFWTVFADGTTWQNSLVQKPYIAKYRDAGAAATLTQGAVSSYAGDGFFVIHRYADILLIYAEAANMAEGGPSVAATDAVNLVRRRAAENNQALYPDLPYNMSQTAFDAAVIAERNWELAFEGDRWFDLVRKEMVVSANIAEFPWVKAFHALLPKPLAELQLLPLLQQNPGYTE